VYGNERAQVLRDNMETQLYYRPADLTTARYLEERLGDVSAFAVSETTREGTTTSEGRSERGVPLLSTQAALQLPDPHIIGFHRHLPPLKLARVDWRPEPALSTRRQLPPPALPTLPDIPQPSFDRHGQPATAGYVD
jgi:type IV secretory pathway TraG/TraD family ATPase VirD4